MTVFAPAQASVWRQITDYGLEPEPLFRKHGVDPAAIFDPEARIPLAAMDRLVAEAIEQTRDPFFGLREAEYFLPAHLGPLGFAWLASTSLSDALKRLQRYASVLNDQLSIAIEEIGGELTVSVSDAAPSLSAYHRDLAMLSVLVRMCRLICGNSWHPQEVLIAYPEPDDTAYFYSLFRCPVKFDSSTNSLLLNAKDTDRRLTGANEHLASLNDHLVKRYLAHRSRTDIVNRARVAILDNLADGQATEKGVAERLHLSPRQLNRKLKAHETSFRQLLGECRRELAKLYIGDSSLSITEVAYMLGFAESSSFSRAYRRWTGVSPSRARTHGTAQAP